MRSLVQATRLRGHSGEKLPDVWKDLIRYKVHFYRSKVSLVAAATGGGKTLFGLAYAVAAKVPTLYFCADLDSETMTVRTGQMLMSESSDTIREHIDSEVLHEELRKASHIELCADSSPTLQDIFEEVQAYYEIYGQYPELIVVDNLVNVQAEADGEGGWAAVRLVLDKLHDLGRETEAHVMVLAHVTGFYDNGDKAIPLNGLEFKPSKVVELVLTLTRDEDEMRVYPVKNSDGVASANAGLFVSLRAEMDVMSIRSWND